MEDHNTIHFFNLVFEIGYKWSAEFLITELVACEVRKIGDRCFSGTDNLATKTPFYGSPCFGYAY